MKNITACLCMALAAIIISCSPDSEDTVDASNLIGDYFYYLVAKTSKGDYVSGINENPTQENFTHIPGHSWIGSSCDHTLGPGLGPAWDESFSSGSIYFVKFNNGYCGGFEENSRFNTFFDPGTYSFSNGYEKGIYIDLSFNFESEIYYTTKGVEQPGASYIRIVNSEPDNEEFGWGYFNFGQIVTGEFRARLVNPDDPSDILEVTDGRFKLRVESYSEGRLD